MAKSLDAVFKRIVQEHNVAYRHNAIVSLRNDVSDQEGIDTDTIKGLTFSLIMLQPKHRQQLMLKYGFNPLRAASNPFGWKLLKMQQDGVDCLIPESPVFNGAILKDGTRVWFKHLYAVPKVA